MLVHKWRAFIGPYERVSVIHRFPQKQEPKGEVPASLSPSINQRLTNQLKPLPSRGRKAYSMQNISFSLLWDSFYGIIRTETHSFVQLMIMERLEFTGEEAEGYASEVTCPVPPRVGAGVGAGRSIRICKAKRPWFAALADFSDISFPTIANFKSPTIFNKQFAKFLNI